MLQAARWEIRRRRRLLVPFATPVYQALCRSFSYTIHDRAASPAEVPAAEDKKEPISRNDSFANKFTARRNQSSEENDSPGRDVDIFSAQFLRNRQDDDSTKPQSRKQRYTRSSWYPDNPNGRRDDRISDNIDRDFFDQDPSYVVVDAPETDVNRTNFEERPRGYAPRLGDEFDGQEDLIQSSFPVRTKRRWVERKTGLTKSWASESPNALLFKCTADIADRDAWRRKAASMRSVRMPIAVLQMMIRRDILQRREDRELLQLLPQGEHRRTLIDLLASNGHSREDLRNVMYILDGESDQARCERFLASEGHRPIWLFHFVMRPAAKLEKAGTVDELIAYCSDMYDGRRDGDHEKMRSKNNKWRAKDPMQSMDPVIFSHTLKYLAAHSMSLDARLLVKVGDLAIQYLTNMSSWSQHPDKIYHEQCALFNKILRVFSPSVRTLPPDWHRHMAYYWEPQRRLLAMSSSLERPLAVNKHGFETVRQVLAGLDKDLAELRNSERHAQTWPPYLQIGDGIDEMTAAEDNWSRSVAGGTLQQEDGYPLTSQDKVMNILQGRADDGTPTIQQRIIRPPHESMSVWEASIRATRNAEEAWARFQHPPDETSQPTVHEYGAMFAKLCAPDSPPDSSLRPGDRSLNFPIRHNPNLSEFALSRMKPPSVGDLYKDMQSAGIQPEGACLEVLVANAKTIATAHQYLQDSKETTWPLTISHPGGASARALRMVRTPLLAAYIRFLCHVENKPGRQLFKALRICEKRFEEDDESRTWAPYVWGQILKTVSSKTSGYEKASKNLAEQIRLTLRIVDKIEASGVLRRSVLVQLSKSLRKAASQALAGRLGDLERGFTTLDDPLRLIYECDSRPPLAERMHASSEENQQASTQSDEHPWLHLLGVGAVRLKGIFDGLVAREAEGQAVFENLGLESVERLLAREDAVLATDAFEIMSAWAFLGEYEEMASYLNWLLKQWDSEAVLEQLDTHESLPGYADFGDVICLFRLYAEPMLPEERIRDLRQAVQQAQVAWIWPDNNLVTAFCESRQGKSYQNLAHVLEWVRYRQARDRGEQPDTLLRPKAWHEPKDTTQESYARPVVSEWNTSIV